MKKCLLILTALLCIGFVSCDGNPEFKENDPDESSELTENTTEETNKKTETDNDSKTKKDEEIKKKDSDSDTTDKDTSENATTEETTSNDEAANNSTTTENTSVTSINGITVKQLLAALPTSLEEYKAQFETTESSGNNRKARAATNVNFEEIEGIQTVGYKHLGEFTEGDLFDLFLTILKYDVSKSDSLVFDSNNDISSLELNSEEAVECSKVVNLGLESFIDLGIINLSFKDNLVKIFWSFNISNGRKINIYIQGNYFSGKYNKLSCFMKTSDENSLYWFNNFEKNNGKYIRYSSDNRYGNFDTGIFILGDEDLVYIGCGNFEGVKNPTQELINIIMQHRNIIYKTSTGIGSFSYGSNNTNKIPDYEWYQLYDTDGSLILEENIGNIREREKNNYIQKIPLKYISSTQTVQKYDDNKYYFENSEDPIEAIQLVSFEISSGKNGHKEFPCYVTENKSSSQIVVSEPFTFTKNEFASEMITKLNEYFTESNTDEFINSLISQEDIEEMKSVFDNWAIDTAE